MPIEDLARSEVITVSPDESIQSVAKTMNQKSIGSVVVEDGGKPVGIVTDRDITMRVVAEGDMSIDHPVEDVMTENPVTIEQGAGFYQAMDHMSKMGVRRMPVCENDELVGIITADDITELLADEHQQMAEVVRSQRPPYEDIQ